MSSMFDGLTVSAPGMDMTQSNAYGGGVPPQVPTVLPAAPIGGSSVAGAAMISAGPTGLIAKVEPDEFVKLVSQSGPTVVLYTVQNKASAQRMSSDRYVASVSGIVFIAHAGSALRFPSSVRVVAASAVLCNGRPLSNEDFV